MDINHAISILDVLTSILSGGVASAFKTAGKTAAKATTLALAKTALRKTLKDAGQAFAKSLMGSKAIQKKMRKYKEKFGKDLKDQIGEQGSELFVAASMNTEPDWGGMIDEIAEALDPTGIYSLVKGFIPPESCDDSVFMAEDIPDEESSLPDIEPLDLVESSGGSSDVGSLPKLDRGGKSMVYMHQKKVMSTAQHRASAKNCGGYLASVLSDTEQKQMDDMKISGALLIGLTQPSNCRSEPRGCWEWDDGSKYSYSHWHSGEPNDSGNAEDCVEANWVGLNWNDLSCTSSRQAVYILPTDFTKNGACEWYDGTSKPEDNKYVWGVNSADYIYYRNGKNGSWINIGGRLKQVEVSRDGSHVWGVNSGDYIYYRNGKNGSWINIGGRLKNVSVSCDGSHVWGVNSAGYIYYRNGKYGSWINIAGRLKQASVS